MLWKLSGVAIALSLLFAPSPTLADTTGQLALLLSSAASEKFSFLLPSALPQAADLLAALAPAALALVMAAGVVAGAQVRRALAVAVAAAAFSLFDIPAAISHSELQDGLSSLPLAAPAGALVVAALLLLVASGPLLILPLTAVSVVLIVGVLQASLSTVRESFGQLLRAPALSDAVLATGDTVWAGGSGVVSLALAYVSVRLLLRA